MKVQAVNGVSVAWETRAGFGAIRKQPRIFKAKYSGGESFAGSDLSSSHTKSELGDVDSEAEGGAGGPAEEAPQQPTGAPPEWLLTIEQSVRCLACCRVFPSLEALTQHVKQGLHQGFSCRVHYRVLGQLTARERSQRRRVLCPWESQRSRESPPHQGVSAGSQVPQDTAEEGVSAGSQVPEDTAEEGVSALAGPRDPSQHPSAAISVTSHSSNCLCAQPPCEPPGADVKRKRSARGREAEEEAEEKWICFKDIVICVEVTGWSESGRC
ncbi:protein FAM170A-like isoform X1 [Mauremys mutica]|uniref:protein FAM170A-like isoform X1 n=1 Tax=Mauremys mutica TaxID=74926 RepID=UPI001D162E20|nr:protein FAM170A-like isoform X1 [Mauremys mutica]